MCITSLFRKLREKGLEINKLVEQESCHKKKKSLALKIVVEHHKNYFIYILIIIYGFGSVCKVNITYKFNLVCK